MQVMEGERREERECAVASFINRAQKYRIMNVSVLLYKIIRSENTVNSMEIVHISHITLQSQIKHHDTQQ